MPSSFSRNSEVGLKPVAVIRFVIVPGGSSSKMPSTESAAGCAPAGMSASDCAGLLPNVPCVFLSHVVLPNVKKPPPVFGFA